MPINLQGSGNIAEGWGPPPHLEAPNIGALVHAILSNKLARDKMTQESIADTIKNIQTQRQQESYAEALKAAGLTSGIDVSGLPASQSTALAALIQRQQAQKDREARIGRGHGGSSGSGGSGGATGELNIKYDMYGNPYIVGPHGGVHPIKQPGEAKQPKLSPTEKGWAAPEISGLSVNINAPDEDTQSLAPNIPPMPEPQGTPQSAPADKNLTQGYGTDATSMSSDDVRAAYRAGKMTREEAQARLKAMGFSD